MNPRQVQLYMERHPAGDWSTIPAMTQYHAYAEPVYPRARVGGMDVLDLGFVVLVLAFALYAYATNDS